MVGCFEEGQSVSAIFCDLSKAFECVSHQILLAKLVYYGIRGNSLILIQSYLSNRTQTVDYGKTTSSTSLVRAGVPQGSILGPLLFILYVNELSANFSEIKTIQYADDTTLLSNHIDIARPDLTSNTTLQKLQEWFAANNLSLNLNKTELFSFSLRERAEKSVRFLGICLEDRLTWKHHINQLTNKLASTLFLLRRIVQMAPVEVSRTAYMGLFQSRLSYGLLFWGNSAEWQKVFKMQKTALRIMGNKRQTDSCRPLYKEFKILPLPGLYIYQCLNFVKSRESEFITVNSRHDYDTRHGENLLLPQHRLTLTQKSYVRIAIKLFNSLPVNVKSMTLSKFKQGTKSLILEICPYSVDEFFAGLNVYV